jgi:hypothetical protein
MRRVIALALAVAVVTLAAGCAAGRPGARSDAARPQGAAVTPQTAASPSGRLPATTTHWFNDIQMITATAGWSLVWSSDPAASGDPALRPERTSDGGRTWVVVTPPAARSLLVNGQALLYAASARRALMAVNGGDSESTVVFATSDGGQRWTESNTVAGSEAVAFDFTGADRGWLLVAAGAAMGQEPVSVYGTADGGLIWSLLTSDVPVTCDKTGIAFGSVETGWITSVCNGGYQVLVSRDGGVHWSVASLPLPTSACVDGCAARSPWAAGDTTVVQISSYPAAALLLLSADAGQTWRTEAMPAAAGPYPRVTFFGAENAIAVAAMSQGVIGDDFFVTSDGGQRWTAVPAGRQFGNSGAQFDFVSPEVGFSWIPDEWQLYQTSDSGRTWTAVVPQPG